MDEFLTARYRTLESVSDIIGSHNFTQSAVRNDSQGVSHSPRKFRTYDTVAPNIPQGKCPICSGYYPIRLCSDFLRMSVSERSVAGIVWLCPMSQKDAIALTIAIFANNNIIRYFTVANLLPERDRELKSAPLIHFPRSHTPLPVFSTISLLVYSPPHLQQFC